MAKEYNSRQLADLKNIYLGAALNHQSFGKDFKYRKTIKDNFNIITVANRLKWKWLQKNQGPYNFQKSDEILSFAQKEKLKVRGHTLIWKSGLPSWIRKGQFSQKEFILLIKNHIKTVLSHVENKFPKVVIYWDVINEALEEDGSIKTFFWKRMGGDRDGFIRLAFIEAHKYAPNAKLVFNEDLNGELNKESDALYVLFKKLLKEKVPIHGVGFEMHLKNNKIPDYTSIQRNLERFSDLGIEVQITEFDVSLLGDRKKLTKKDFLFQAELYDRIFNICLDLKNCNYFTSWGVTDLYTWHGPSSIYNGHSAPYLFDENYKEKPAFQKILNSLKNYRVFRGK